MGWNRKEERENEDFKKEGGGGATWVKEWVP